ncbi:Aldolase-type TIM barrel [Cynara cardunculus var. scolymus]|uniref:ribulose-phosphate 3-epimerase n=1 Tax=Cynara cardunculus var. scolymus TaxID=59895 RepID=A0A103Y4L9_CYNCS|nr:Aldolase-type TIM barrel [Cynara cardunculus var. scolymus]
MLRFGNAVTTNINPRAFRCVFLSTTTPKFCNSPITDIGISSKFPIMSMAVAAKIAPSMLSSDFANLASEADRMLRSGADWLHMDIMNRLIQYFLLFVAIFSKGVGYEIIHFVPNLTIGAPVIASLRKHTKGYLDCHLMVTNPLDYVEPFGKAGASDNWQELVHQIKAKGMRPGVALKPGTPIEEVYSLLQGEHRVEMVLVMTVEPGFGGQKFMSEMMNKVRTLREKFPTLDIEVRPSTIDDASRAGANCIVAGSSVFGAADPAEVISLLRKSVVEAQKCS